MPTHLPTGVYGSSAVWTGERAYIFGGDDGGENLSNQILEYTPPKSDDTDPNKNSHSDGTYMIWVGFIIILVVAVTAFVVIKKKRSDS
jgi:hypothetical protein